MMGEGLDERIVPLANPAGVTFAPVDPARPSGARMKGFPVHHLLNLMESIDPALPDEWRATLPEATRGLTDRKNVTSVTWLPIEIYFHGVGFLAGRMGGGPRRAIQIGHHTAKQDISAFFRVVMSIASPATVLQLSGRFWKSFFDRGALHITPLTPTSCLATVRQWPLYDEISPHEMAGSLVAWMEASRAQEVRLTRFELQSPGQFILEVHWR